jgi:hypothetical protein
MFIAFGTPMPGEGSPENGDELGYVFMFAADG